MRAVLEPIAAVGDPPTGHADRDGGDDRPPKWQCQVGDETNDREGHPEDFALHGIILAVKVGIFDRRVAASMGRVKSPAFFSGQSRFCSVPVARGKKSPPPKEKDRKRQAWAALRAWASSKLSP